MRCGARINLDPSFSGFFERQRRAFGYVHVVRGPERVLDQAYLLKVFFDTQLVVPASIPAGKDCERTNDHRRYAE